VRLSHAPGRCVHLHVIQQALSIRAVGTIFVVPAGSLPVPVSETL
jgi:hypothetical protein